MREEARARAAVRRAAAEAQGRQAALEPAAPGARLLGSQQHRRGAHAADQPRAGQVGRWDVERHERGQSDGTGV